MSETPTKDYSSLYLPGAIVLAGALVAVGLFFGLTRTGNGIAAGGQPVQKEVNVKDVKLDGAPFIGKADAPLTMAFWSDFQCPFCKAVEIGGGRSIDQATLSAHDQHRAAIAVLAPHSQPRFDQRARRREHRLGRSGAQNDRLEGRRGGDDRHVLDQAGLVRWGPRQRARLRAAVARGHSGRPRITAARMSPTSAR